jgi:hypothetical protein
MKKLKLPSFLKKYLVIIVLSLAIIAGNVICWYLARDLDTQMGWIAFILVWLNLALSWLTYRRTAVISYFFISVSIILEIFVLLNIFWVSTQIL